jgi:2-polyprenyl-3-methyl-5-hydroxy-6-metoxy-1,4-benzoquinol methylase
MDNEVIVEALPLHTDLLAEKPNLDLITRVDMRILRDSATGLLRQKLTTATWNQLREAYVVGSLLGTAIDNTNAGINYAQEFLAFLENQLELKNLEVLEIGCGTGYLASCVSQRTKSVMGIEPGGQHLEAWNSFGVNVQRGFFPDVLNDGQMFDAIYSCSVLEHFPDLETHFRDCMKHLKKNGHILLSVPDCEEYFRLGDPSVLLHEHLSYFTEKSLRNTLIHFGFNVISIVKSNYGSVLFAHAQVNYSDHLELSMVSESDSESSFIRTVNQARKRISSLLEDRISQGITIGIYCPARGLNSIPSVTGLRLFDDDDDVHGKFYPTWPVQVESFEDLKSRPVDEIWILSVAFEGQIAKKIRDEFPKIKILNISQLINA